MRDSETTRTRIVAAVGRVLATQGFGRVGVNAVAREAGVDKVLLYRYFGGLPELLQHYARRGGFWPTVAELAGGPVERFSTLLEAGTALLTGHLRELRARPLTQEIMRWELHQRNELTDELARHRERQGDQILALLPKPAGTDEIDVAAAAAVLHAGLTYLVLRQKTADVYLGVDLTSEAGWERLSRAVTQLLAGLLDRQD